MKKGRIIANVILSLFLIFGLAAFFSAVWYSRTYGVTGFDSILFTLFSNLSGTGSELIIDWALKAVLPTVICAVAICLLLFYSGKSKGEQKSGFFPLPRYISVPVSIIISAALICTGAVLTELPQWLVGNLDRTTIYEDYYIDPADAEITFPEEKRNLIYIMLESMETTFLSEDIGGGNAVNLIPNLTRIAEENINFSHNEFVGGFAQANGATWTVGSMVAQTAGVPLSIPIDANSYGTDGVFLPDITNLSDILHQNGYRQYLMVGSDSDFGGRKTYYSTHNTDEIYDLYTAYDDGIVPDGYYVFWGMEDLYTYGYAKQKLTEIASESEPFAFTMLTVDTHHVGGYTCSLCGTEHENAYENVFSCADAQLNSFLEWLKTQDFYNNTTVIICGDHATMDYAYFSENYNVDFERRIYNCFINSAVSTDNTKNRVFTTLDLFPTTLAALGCTIENDRLGLGTNLFSDTATLAESMGLDNLQKELNKNSLYYKKFY